MSTTETLFFKQVTYTQKETRLSRKKYPFNPDEKAREPLRLSREVVVIKDSTTKITYTWKERMKRHVKYGKFYLQKTTSDTTNINVKANLTYSSYMFSGSFIAPENTIHTSRYSEKGITFNVDGSCVHTYGTTGSDTPISSLYQRLGEYKVLNDTIYIVYYLGKQKTRSINKFTDSTKSASINELSWGVIKPYQVNYVLSDHNDSLRKISKDIFYKYLIAKDTVRLLPTQNK